MRTCVRESYFNTDIQTDKEMRKVDRWLRQSLAKSQEKERKKKSDSFRFFFFSLNEYELVKCGVNTRRLLSETHGRRKALISKLIYTDWCLRMLNTVDEFVKSNKKVDNIVLYDDKKKKNNASCFFDKFGYFQVASADSIYVSKRTAEENKF